MPHAINVEDRLSALEVQNRRLRGGLLALAGAAAVTIGVGWTTGQRVPEVIEANECRIVDDNGQAVISLAVTDAGGGRILVYNNDGTIVGGLRTTPEGDGVVAVHNRFGEVGAGFWTSDDGGMGRVFGPSESTAVEMVGLSSGGEVAVKTQGGNVGVALSARGNEGQVAIRNATTGASSVLKPEQ